MRNRFSFEQKARTSQAQRPIERDKPHSSFPQRFSDPLANVRKPDSGNPANLFCEPRSLLCGMKHGGKTWIRAHLHGNKNFGICATSESKQEIWPPRGTPDLEIEFKLAGQALQVRDHISFKALQASHAHPALSS